MTSSLKPVRGCSECVSLNRQRKWIHEDLGNLKVKFYRRHTPDMQAKVAARAADLSEAEGNLARHLDGHPPPPDRPDLNLPVTPARVTGWSTVTIETITFAGGEARECGDTAVAGRKYLPNKIVRTVESGGDHVRVTGRIVNRDGNLSNRTVSEDFTGDDMPDWVTSILDARRSAA